MKFRFLNDFFLINFTIKFLLFMINSKKKGDFNNDGYKFVNK